ncbi:MAG: DivIVA domain-containing protein [Gemmatimonadales bacterium]
MTDDAFHLTPHDVRAQEFQTSMRGYDRAQVDDFKLRVAEEMERLLRERLQWEERLKNMQEQLRAFRDRERAMNEALIAAQQLRAESRQQADREAEAVIREAKSEAMRVLAEAQQEERGIRERSDAAHRQFAAYLANFRALLERQLGELEGLQAHAQTMSQIQTEMSLKRHA